MKYVWVFLLCTAVASGTCPPRESTMRCFYAKADYNGDGIVTRSELANKVFSALSWYEKVPFTVFGGIDRIMADCDVNGDGTLTVDESLDARKCMDSCFKRKHTTSKFKC